MRMHQVHDHQRIGAAPASNGDGHTTIAPFIIANWRLPVGDGYKLAATKFPKPS
jgi:hypothetical protein